MTLARFSILILICVGAGWIGFHTGRPGVVDNTVQGKGEAASGSPDHRLVDLHGITTQRKLSELSPAIATSVEAALANAAGDPFVAMESLLSLENDLEKGEAMFELIGRMDASQLGLLVTGMAEAGEDSARAGMLTELFGNSFALLGLFDRWSNLDPEGVTAFVLSPTTVEGDAETAFLLRALALGFLAPADPAAARELGGQLREMMSRRGTGENRAEQTVNYFLAAGMAISDPAASIRALREGRAGMEAMSNSQIFEVAGPHAEAVLAELMKLPPAEGRTGMLESLYASWGAYDLPVALVSIGELEEGGVKSKLLYGALEAAAGKDPQTAAQHWHLLPEGELRRGLSEYIVRQWAQEDPVEAMRWAREELDETAFLPHFERAANLLPTAAGKALVEGLSREARAQILGAERTIATDTSHFVRRMLAEDPEGTLAWLGEHQAVDVLHGSVVADAFAATGIDSAIEFVTRLPAEAKWAEDYVRYVAGIAGATGDLGLLAWTREQGAKAHEVAIGSWAQQQPEAATAYAIRERPDLLPSTIGSWARNDPAAAYEWLIEAQSGNVEQLGSVISDSALLNYWTNNDPAAAAEAMTRLPEEIAGPQVADVIGRWAKLEPASASEYLASHLNEEGPVRDTAVRALIDKIKARSPDEAAVWAESITDPAARAAALDALAGQ